MDSGLVQQKAVAIQIRGLLRDSIEWLEGLPDCDDETRKFALTWQNTLATLAWDVSGAALGLACNGSLRGARILNRSLLEYAARLHRYVRQPGKAYEDGLFAPNMARKLMRPTRNFQGDMSDTQYADFRKFMDGGEADVNFPAVQSMIKSMLKNFRLTSSKVREFARWLEVEYALGSGMAHSSQAAILDVFTMNGAKVRHFGRSPHFRRIDEVVRASSCMLVLLCGLELDHKKTFGTARVISDLVRYRNSQGKISIFQHNALLSLLPAHKAP